MTNQRTVSVGTRSESTIGMHFEGRARRGAADHSARPRSPHGRLAILFALLLTVATSSQAEPPADPLTLIPADAPLCWRGRPKPGDEARSGQTEGPSALATLVDVGTRVAGAPLKPRQRIALRMTEAFGVALNQPFAFAFLGARAKPTEDGKDKKVEGLQLALVVQTNGQSSGLRRVIQKIVNEGTDAGSATLERAQAGAHSFDLLIDRRLPEPIAWGEIDRFFVVTYGAGVWPRIAEVAAGHQPSLAADGWMVAARKEIADPPLIEIVADARSIRERLDPFVGGGATSFFKAWGAESLERGYWALGFRGDGLFCTGVYLENGVSRRVALADPAFADERARSLIPDGSRFAFYRVRLADILPQLISAYYATRPPQERDAAERSWTKLQAKLGVDVSRDFLDLLGADVLLHNDPPHPLNIPLAFTGLTEIRSESGRVRATVDQVCEGWRERMEESESKEPSLATLIRDDDGIWSFQYGPLAGVAWTVTDRYFITSWSPNALRSYLQKVGEKAGKPVLGR